MPHTSVRRRILSNRVKLIRALESYVQPLSWQEQQIAVLSNTIKRIRQDTDAMLALEPEYTAGGGGGVSYSELPANKWYASKRRRTSIGRYIRQKMGVQGLAVDDHVLEQLGYHLVNQVVDLQSLPIEVVSGEAITEAYAQGDTKWHSCMTGEQSYFTEFYALNPERISLIIYANKARALLWTTDEGIQVMDRIYPNAGAHIYLMKRWAAAKGYVYRINSGAPYTGLSDGLAYHVQAAVNKFVPYFDTFMFWSYTRDNLVSGKHMILMSNQPLPSSSMSTRHFPSSVSTCGICGGYIWDTGTMVGNSGPYCQECAEDRMPVCAVCLGVFLDTSLAYIEDIKEFQCLACTNENSNIFSCQSCGRTCTAEGVGHCIVHSARELLVCEHCVGGLGIATRYAVCDYCHEVVGGRVYAMGNRSSAICSECLTPRLASGQIRTCADCMLYDEAEHLHKEEIVGNVHRFYCEQCWERRQAISVRKKANKENPVPAPKSKSRPSFVEMLPD